MENFQKIKHQVYDAVIVGAGPAGCSAAFFAARKGFHVLLVDKSAFPRDKTCGDGISPRTMMMFDRMGVLERIENSGAHRVTGVIVSSPDGSLMRSKVPDIDGYRNYGLVMPRKDLDDLLFTHVCRERDVDVLQNTKITGLKKNGRKIIGVIADRDGTSTIIRGDSIIAADGGHSMMAKKFKLRNNKHKHTAFGIRGYFENVDGLSDCLEVHYDKMLLPGYAWVFPTGPNSANIGLGVFNRYTDTRGINKIFQSFLKENRFISKKLKRARLIERSLKGWPMLLGSFPGPRSRENALLIGDAGSMVDPVTGEGIYAALKTGELAITALEQCRKNHLPINRLGRIYERLWQREFKWKEFKSGYFHQTFLASEKMLNAMVRRASKNHTRAEALAGITVHILPLRKLFI